MRIDDLIWRDEIVEKLAVKHRITPSEIEQVFLSEPYFRFISKGRHTRDEDVYAGYGRTDAGRYLTVFFIHKPGGLALIISARDMDEKERRRYGKQIGA